MPRDPFAKVAIGDAVSFSAQAWNAMLDAGKAYQQKGTLSASAPVQSRSSTILRVRNDTGNNLPRGSVLGLDGPVFTPTDSLNAFMAEVAFKGVTPDVTKHRRRFAVLLEPSAASTGYGGAPVSLAYLAGLCPVLVDVVDQSHEYANIDDNVTANLKSSRHGHARILWAEWQDSYSGYSTGVQWCVVMLGVTGSSTAVGKANGDIDPRSGSTAGTGRVDLYRSTTGIYSDPSLEGPVETIDVLNSSAEEFGSYGTGIPDGMEVSVWWDADDVAWVAPLECTVH